MDITRVILVDEKDNQVGEMEKLEAHRKAILHRAVSVFIINKNGEWILQRRAMDKYHSQGLWTNACCTHPYPGESSSDAAHRRLKEEMGMDCEVKEIFSFVYKEKLDNELTEFEFDHVFIGITDNLPLINRDEVHEWKKATFGEIEKEISENASSYTVWFREIYKHVNEHIINQKKF